MELILLAVGAIVWIVLKALSQPPPKPPPPRQRVSHASEAGEEKDPTVSPSQLMTGSQYFAHQEEITVEVEDLDGESAVQGISLTSENLVQSVVMAEVLGPPRARKPHRMQR